MSDVPEHNHFDMKRNEHGRRSREQFERARELKDKINALRQEYHEQLYADSQFNEGNHRVRRQFRYYRRHIHYGRPIVTLVMLLFWIAIFLFAGFPAWLRVTVAFFAILSTMSGVMEIVFLFRMDKRIITPLDNLEQAVREIAEGNYGVRVTGPFHPETAALVRTFNAMAQSLEENEVLKKSYESNRKDLIANISHDLKTPITSVLGYLEAIDEIGSVDPGRIAKYLSIIKSNAAYMNKLIDDLFLFSRLDMRRLDFNFESVNARDFIRDLMEEFSLEFGELDIAFDYADRFPDAPNAPSAPSATPEPPEGNPFAAKIDPKLFYRVIRNLFDNARKYGPEKGLRLEVSAGLREMGEGQTGSGQARRFYVSVADNGPGLSASAMEHLFERFFRADKERTKNVASTGLGLAIARELVEAHGGGISAKNRTEGGLEFTIEIPLEEIAK